MRTLATLLAVMVLVTPGCSRFDSAETHYERAEKQLAQGGLQGAIIELKNALQKNPDFGKARYLIGATYNKLRQGPAAEAELRRAMKLEMILGGRVAAELGTALILSGRPKDVLTSVTPSDAYEPGPLAGVHIARARAHLALRQKAEAVKEAEIAERLQPQGLDVMMFGALLRAADGDLPGAMEIIDRTIAQHPKEIDAYALKADLVQQKGDDKETLAMYDKLLELAPTLLPARIARATVRIRVKDLDGAQKDIAEIRKLQRNHHAAFYLDGLIQFTKGKPRDALGSVLNALKANPNYPAAQLLAGSIYLQLGSYRQAEQLLTQYLRRDPGSASARRLLATTLIQLNQGKRALEVIEPELGKNVRDSALLELAGDAYLRSGDFAAATKSYEQASGAGDPSARLRTQLGISRLAAGSYDQGVADLEAAIALDPRRMDADYLLIMSHVRNRQPERARAAAQDLVKRQPKNPAAYNLLASVLLMARDTAGGKAELEKALQLDPAFFPAAANLARLDLQAKDHKAARKRFEGVLAKTPGNSAAMLAMSEIAASAAAFDEMVDWLERARKAQPAAIEPRGKLVMHYLQVGERRKALEIANEALAANPDHPTALDLVGTAQLANGDQASALAAYERVVARHPNYLPGYLKLALAHQTQKRSKEAEAALRKALALAPNNAEAISMLASVLSSSGRGPQALKLVEDARRAQPKSPGFLVMEGDVLMREQRYADAARAYEAGLKAAPNSYTARRLFEAVGRGGQRDKALAFLQQWVKDHPADFESRMQLADALLQSGNADGARDHYEKVLAQVPRHLIAMNNLANLYRERKDPRALGLAEQAYKLQPGMPAIADTYGWMLVEQGKHQQAVDILRKAVAAAPNIPEVHYHLGVALAQSGDKPGARESLEKALSLKRPFSGENDAKARLKSL